MSIRKKKTKMKMVRDCQVVGMLGKVLKAISQTKWKKAEKWLNLHKFCPFSIHFVAILLLSHDSWATRN